MGKLITQEDIAHRFDSKYYYEKVVPKGIAFLNRFFGEDGIHYSGIEPIKSLGNEVNIVFTPNHRSHLDYFVLPFIFYKEGMKVAATAGGDNLFINLFSLINFDDKIRKCKGYKILRHPENKENFIKTLIDYTRQLLLDEENIVVFPEKGRSYTGKFVRFSSGSIGVMMDAAEKAGKNIYFVPVNISYEKVIDNLPLLRKYKSSRKGIINKINKAKYYVYDWPYIYLSSLKQDPKIGVTVNFGEPISSEAFSAENKQLSPKELKDELASKLQEKCQELQSVHDTQLGSFTIRGKNPIEEPVLLENIASNRKILAQRGANISGLDEDPENVWGRTESVLRCFRRKNGCRIYTLDPTEVDHQASTIEHLLKEK